MFGNYSSDRRARFLPAIRTEAADLGSGDGDFDTAIAGNLMFQLLVQVTFEFAHLPAANARDVDVVAGAMGFVEMAVAAQVKQIELVN